MLDLTGSASDLGYVLAARSLPMLLLVALGGVWADRLPRQSVMLTADAVRCVSQGLVAALLLTGRTGTLVLNPVGFAVVGPIAAAVGIRTTLLGSALLAASATLATPAVPSVRAMRADGAELEPAPAA